MMPRLDHLIYAAPDLETAIDDLAWRLGVRAAAGGSHPGEGTRNALIGLGPASYLEILAPDPAQPAPDRPLWLGVEGRAWPRLTAWAARGAGLEDLVRRAPLGPVASGSRRRSDGTLLSWRFTDPHVQVAGGVVPFFIDWGTSPHPAASAPAGVTLRGLRGEHPDPVAVDDLLRVLGVELPVTKGPRAALIAVLETPKGLMELR
jgi:hypothetical protein